jgi:nitrite reductase (NADH) small subunit
MHAVREEETLKQWIPIARIDDIPRQGARVVTTATGNIAVFRSIDDRVFALLDRCPHKGGPLSQGIVHGRRVTCPLHNWVIELESGQAVAPDEGCARRFEVRVEEGMIAIALPVYEV